jgi:Ras-related protein Rab-2A
MDADLELKL